MDLSFSETRDISLPPACLPTPVSGALPASAWCRGDGVNVSAYESLVPARALVSRGSFRTLPLARGCFVLVATHAGVRCAVHSTGAVVILRCPHLYVADDRG